MSKYLYNGVKLPALPEWDKTVYPYAFIYIVTLDGTTGVYTLVVSSSSVMGYDRNGIICPAATVGQRYTVSEDSWAAAADSDDFYIKRDNLIYAVWANFDVLNSDGSVYVAASEPVPLMEKFPIREWIGWLIAGLCSRPLPMGAREPVAYLYNGVRLPGLPEWDKEMYPCAIIEHTSVSAYLRIGKSLIYRTTESGTWQYGLLYSQSSHLAIESPQNGWGDFWDSGVYYWGSLRLKDQKWTNTDILNADGSVWLSASDPVPVYE